MPTFNSGAALRRAASPNRIGIVTPVGESVVYQCVQILRRDRVLIETRHNPETSAHLDFHEPAGVIDIVQGRAEPAFPARMTHRAIPGENLLTASDLRIGNVKDSLDRFATTDRSASDQGKDEQEKQRRFHISSFE